VCAIQSRRSHSFSALPPRLEVPKPRVAWIDVLRHGLDGINFPRGPHFSLASVFVPLSPSRPFLLNLLIVSNRLRFVRRNSVTTYGGRQDLAFSLFSFSRSLKLASHCIPAPLCLQRPVVPGFVLLGPAFLLQPRPFLPANPKVSLSGHKTLISSLINKKDFEGAHHDSLLKGRRTCDRAPILSIPFIYVRQQGGHRLLRICQMQSCLHWNSPSRISSLGG